VVEQLTVAAGNEHMAEFDRKAWDDSFWKAVEAGQSLDYADIEWYAPDRHNSIAFFTTGGPGPIPRSVLRDRAEYTAVLEFFESMPAKAHADILVTESRNIGDWEKAAERGLYSFDSERGKGRAEGYYMVARPDVPVHVDDLPGWVREWLDRVRLENTVFAESTNSPVFPTDGR
jgi:hypothetical protein